MNTYDVVVIGAGSVGVPIALSLAEKKKNKVLVLDALPSFGQGQNKKAIGGIRATHSDFGKIKTCQRSIDIFSTWKEKYGYDIGWMKMGYSFPAYNEDDEKKLKNLLEIQKSFGLNIKWVSKEEYAEIVPGINEEGLRGSTYAPDDGSASPLLALSAFYFKSLEYDVKYHFKEKVTGIICDNGKVTHVRTDKGKYACNYVVNAAGNYATEIGNLAGIDLPVLPDSHEGGITEPVERFFGPMIVDMRPAEGSANYYFYQSNEGQVVFCITPQPIYAGTESESTSVFLPQVAKRMVSLYPRLANLKIRRTWRGQYPMTPDGFPIVGLSEKLPNYAYAVGMCGQGFMLGPGLGEIVARLIMDESSADDIKILEHFSLDRNFSGLEQFK